MEEVNKTTRLIYQTLEGYNNHDNELFIYCSQRGMLSLIVSILHLTVIEAIIYSTVLLVAFSFLRKYLEKQTIDNLSQKAVFISGCDTGFGRGLAIKCLQNGMPVFAGCLTQDGIESLQSETKNSKGKLDAFLLNVGNDKSCEEAGLYIEKKVNEYGGLHAVVNNAGITGKFLTDDFLSVEDYKKVNDINMFGVIRTTHCVKKLIKKAKGRVITVASICARVGLPGLGPYTSAKYGVSGYCDVLRNELRPFGVSVHILEPGFFETPLINREKINREILQAWNESPQEIKEEYGEKYFNERREKAHLFLNSISSKDVSLVVDAYFHAITSKWPRSRYQVGYDSVWIFIPFSFLPTGLQDSVFAIINLFLPKPAKC